MARMIPSAMAPIVEQFEVDGDRVVSVSRIEQALRELALDLEPREVGYRLQREGWLGSLRTQGAWEFLPAARGGAYSAGDRFIEFRAQRAVDPSWPGVLAMESTASVLGLAQRIPESEVLALPPNELPPKVFAGQWRVVRLALPGEGLTVVQNLPTWNLEGLLAGISARPASYRDMPGLAQWLPEAVGQVEIGGLLSALEGLPRAACQRAAYLLGLGGNQSASARVLESFPPRHLAWLGPRKRGGHYDSSTQVNDTELHQFMSVGGGA